MPFLVTLVGVALLSFARPPENETAKSPGSRSPVPLLALNTISENVTAAVLLSLARTTLEIVGASLSIRVLVLSAWLVCATLPDASKMASAAGDMVSTSAPLGVPSKPIPSVYTLPFLDIVVGFACDRVAPAPARLKVKSSESSAPVPSLLLKMGSLNVTAIVPLLLARSSALNMGDALSLRFAVLPDCSVTLTLPTASNMDVATGVTPTTSAPFGVPLRLMPSV